MTKILNVDIILVGTTHPGNIGAIARAMGNMGLKNLILANPQCNHLDEVAISRATDFANVLKKTKVFPDLKSAIGKYTKVYGFSARERTLKQRTITVNQASKEVVIDKIQHNHKVAYVFGPERTGLTNQDTDLCDVLVTIPMIKKSSSLNIAAAVQIAAYELLINTPKNTVPKNKLHDLATKQEIIQLLSHAEEIIRGYYPISHPGKLNLLMRRLSILVNHTQAQSSDVKMLRGLLSYIQKSVTKTK